ncbi:MAG TPA: YbhB/YbcL family Raf kinase inhibitor-like protein [Chitinophagaceae bacterium]|jgi:Raf kinase inhibitor-like YbhB/YbcL family protein|nr:YbhB/YbcL family Raf kinase inhibitor-like protein [Chitinophagaceae bacterium]
MKKIIVHAVIMLTASLSYAQTFTLKSKDLNGQVTAQQVLNGFGCTGQNLSPQLSWENAPSGTKSFAVTVYDKDAPTGSGWWHWVVFDIPATSTELERGAGDVSKKLLPGSAIQGITDFGSTGYGGPCPPPGDRPHQYIITIYALKINSLGLDAKASPALVGYYLNGNTLAKASIVVYYQR